MPTYEFVNVRFNMENKDEKTLYESLKGKKATHIKSILKQVFIGNGIEFVKKTYIEEIIGEYLSNKKIQFNIGIEPDIVERKNINENDLLLAALNHVKGGN
jgi:hypothetical protein